MEAIDFGRALLETEDLDPIYCALHRMRLDSVTLNRWLLAYWCFYDAGLACYAAQHSDYWGLMREAALNETSPPIGGRWKRGTERRHFRGDLARKSIEDLRRRYRDYPENMASVCAAVRFSPIEPIVYEPASIHDVFRRVKTHVGFGDWIAFKIADMVERVMRLPVDFDEGVVFMFKDPVKGAEMVRERYGVPDAVAYLREALGERLAPPSYDRRINLQEIETILCKWKSHVNGRYEVGKDSQEIRESVEKWDGFTPLASEFLRGLPV